VVRVSGRMVFDLSLFQLREHVRKALDAEIRRFAIDLSETPFIDSSACGELISVYTSITSAGGLLVIVKPSERVRMLLERIKLTRILSIVETLDQAEKLLLR
jgi:anti-anti-sigma factor